MAPPERCQAAAGVSRTRRGTVLGCALVAALGLSGCAGEQNHIVNKNLMTDKLAAERNAGVAEHYQVACPDVLEIAVAGRKEFKGH